MIKIQIKCLLNFILSRSSKHHFGHSQGVELFEIIIRHSCKLICRMLSAWSYVRSIKVDPCAFKEPPAGHSVSSAVTELASVSCRKLVSTIIIQPFCITFNKNDSIVPKPWEQKTTLTQATPQTSISHPKHNGNYIEWNIYLFFILIPCINVLWMTVQH